MNTKLNDDILASTGNTAKEQEMFFAGVESGEANAKNNAEVRGADGWLPIESAPKDGTEIIVFHPQGGVCAGFCPGEGFAWHCMDGMNTVIGKKSRQSIPAMTSFTEPPTHWQPLPAAPTAPVSTVEQDERQAFEAWVIGQHPESPPMLWREDEGYVYVNSEWKAWQARARIAAPAAPGSPASSVATEGEKDDDSIALDRLADYIADNWPEKKYGLEEICQRLHAMWPGEFIPLEDLSKNLPNVREALRALLIHWKRFQKSDGNQQDAYNLMVKGARHAWQFAEDEINRVPVPAPAAGDEQDSPAIAALRLALKYWEDRQQRYKNRSPVWVEAARDAIAAQRKGDA